MSIKNRWYKRYRHHALVVVVLILTYVGADLWWWSYGRHELAFAGTERAAIFSGEFFAAPLGLKTFLYTWGDRVFIDLGWKYKRLTSPFKPARDPDGKEYFPPDFSNGYEFRYSIFSWSGAMRRFGEPSLFDPSDQFRGKTTLRLTLHSAGGNLFTCRFSAPTDTASPATAVLVWIDRESGETLRRKTLEVPAERWDVVRGLIASPDIWKPLNESEQFLPSSGQVGATWFFEIRDENGYRKLMIYSPDIIGMVLDRGVKLGDIRDFRKHALIGKMIQEISPHPVPGMKPESP